MDKRHSSDEGDGLTTTPVQSAKPTDICVNSTPLKDLDDGRITGARAGRFGIKIGHPIAIKTERHLLINNTKTLVHELS